EGAADRERLAERGPAFAGGARIRLGRVPPPHGALPPRGATDSGLNIRSIPDRRPHVSCIPAAPETPVILRRDLRVPLTHTRPAGVERSRPMRRITLPLAL